MGAGMKAGLAPVAFCSHGGLHQGHDAFGFERGLEGVVLLGVCEEEMTFRMAALRHDLGEAYGFHGCSGIAPTALKVLHNLMHPLSSMCRKITAWNRCA